MHLYMQFRPEIGSSPRHPGAKRAHEATNGMLCHNICRKIRVARELDVIVTFDGERESNIALHVRGFSAHGRVLTLTCEYIYVKCT
jgi:hypothetical protein